MNGRRSAPRAVVVALAAMTTCAGAGWLAVARALARPRGLARLVPARLRGALLRRTVERLLEERGLPELLAVLAGGDATSTSTPTSTTTSPTATTRDTVVGLRRIPATCLHRALAGYALLREAGEDARFVIGVSRDGGEVVAHAWIEQGGAPVGEPEDPRARFTVAYVHPASPPAQRERDAAPMSSPRPSPDVILTKLADGTGVLLHLGTKFYFALNATGVAVWEALAAGQAPDPDALVDLLVARFSGVDRAAARADVDALLHDLAAEGLLAKEG